MSGYASSFGAGPGSTRWFSGTYLDSVLERYFPGVWPGLGDELQEALGEHFSCIVADPAAYGYDAAKRDDPHAVAADLRANVGSAGLAAYAQHRRDEQQREDERLRLAHLRHDGLVTRHQVRCAHPGCAGLYDLERELSSDYAWDEARARGWRLARPEQDEDSDLLCPLPHNGQDGERQ